MLRVWRGLLAVPLILVIACGQAAAPRGGSDAPARAPGPTGPKRLVLAVISEPVGFNLAIETQRLSVTQAGLAYYLFPGLTVLDHQEALRPTVGEAVPSIENGLWKVFPDGRMETTHPIRPGASWHDGTPLTGEDLRFTVAVLQDKDLPQFRMLGVDLIEHVEARARRGGHLEAALHRRRRPVQHDRQQQSVGAVTAAPPSGRVHLEQGGLR